jgi:hypothetical protein
MRRRAIAGSFRITTSTLVSLTAARAMSSAAGCSPETPSLRCQEGFLGQVRGRSSVQLRGRRHRGWELAARYCTVSLNSDVISRVPESVTGGVYGGQQQIAALALSWYLNDRLRFMLQFQYVDVNKLNPAGKIQIGQRFETIAGRVQATW